MERARSGSSLRLDLEPGKTATAKIVADKPGVFSFYCTEFCSALHLEMQGYLLVQPKGYKAKAVAMEEGVEGRAHRAVGGKGGGCDS